MRQEALLQHTDFMTVDPAENHMPPPAYNDIYGEIRNEKDGLGTTACVTDDGRVNIRINQSNRHLSRIFAPVLYQQVKVVQKSCSPPFPYIPPSLGGDERASPPPPLNIVIQVVGSRGDAQPFVALGKVLKDTYGHRVRLATHSNFKGLVQENGLEFFSIGGDPSQLMAFMVKNPRLMPGIRSVLSGDVGHRRKDVAQYIQGCWRSCYAASDKMGLATIDDNLSEPAERPFVADCIIANPPSFAHIHCAEKLGIPLHIMFTMPYSPTQAFPHPLANVQSSNTDPRLANYISYAMIELLTWQGIGDIINRFRAKCLGLDPVSLIWAPGMLHRLNVPHTYCWSPALIPKPKDWGPHISVSGFYFLNLATNFIPAPDLQAFLDAGPPPVYIGFGSIVLDDPNAMTELIFEAARKTGQRILLSKGWGDMGADGFYIPEQVFMLGNVPHDWLFKHVSCVVHHGGAGTTAAGISAGRPTVVVPFFGDQPFWGAMVARAGAGPDPIPHKQLTADKLANAINFCLKPESLERARELASKVAGERGSDMGAQLFHQFLEPDRLRCTVAPSRCAVWRVRRSKVRLSAFAACALANANLLDFDDLKLFRPQEYCTDEGPWDPVSGGAAACWRAFSGMMMGLVEVPSETLKPLHIAAGSSRQHSQESVQTIARKSESSDAWEIPTPPISPAQNQASFRSSSMSDALQGHSSLRQDNANRSRVHSRNESGFEKNHDMLHQGVHTSKGLGRIAKAAVQAPMEISLGMTKGFHNFPKLWGDDTVRPHQQVTDFKSGAMAAGKEFGYGWYDGVTGLVTQPWKGAQKDGVGGFVKGFGKGIAGFATKPFAGFAGIFGHTLKGVQKEVLKFFGSNVQNHIVASRVAQGYEEWLKSSIAEKQDVILRWKAIQKHLKRQSDLEEVVQDNLEVQHKTNIEDAEASLIGGHTEISAQSTSAHGPILDPESAIHASGGSQVLKELRTAAGINDHTQLSAQDVARGGAEEDTNIVRAIQEDVSRLQRDLREAADNQADEENLRQAVVASEAEAQRHAVELLEYEKQLKRVMTQSLMKQRQSDSDSRWETDISPDDEDDDGEFERAIKLSEKMAEKSATGGSPGIEQSSSYDPGHLAGTTKREFETQQQGQQGQKTAEEKTEEEIVLEYIRKQSLLEQQHQNKGKGRATATEDNDDKDLQNALKLSMRGHKYDARYR